MQRQTLTNGKRGKKNIDMEMVYAEIDRGKTVKAVAAQFKVSERTLYRRHAEYQKQYDVQLSDENRYNDQTYNPF